MKKQNHKYDFWFDSSKSQENLKEKSIKGGVSTSASQFIGFALNLISTFVLARLILPSDFGIVGMVTAFTGLANIIKDMGLSMAVIQKESITHKQVSNIFWINVVICSSLALIFAICSPLISLVYQNDKRIYAIVFSYAIGIVISGFSIQHYALLSRKMLFSRIAKGNVAASLLSVIFGIAAAIIGMGYWSIVILNISMITFYTIFMWVSCNWRPSLPFKNQHVTGFLKFGAGISGFNIINYFSRYSDDILIGNRLGPTAVGFYTKAYQLLMLPINQLRNPLSLVATPALSALKNHPVRYVNYYRRYLFLLAFFSMPLVASLAIFSKELIFIVLGPGWEESSRIFQVLAVAGLIQPIASSSGLVMISTGQSKRFFVLGCINSVVIVSGFIIGINWGVIGTAIALVISNYLLLLPTLAFAYKGTPIKMKYFFVEVGLPFIHTLLMCGTLMAIKIILSSYLSDILIFIFSAPIGILFYYFSWKGYPKGREKFIAIDDTIRIVYEKIKKAKFINNFKYRQKLSC